MHNGKLLIARRPQGDRLEHKWEFPGGKIKANETPEACLVREMREEFEIEVEVGENLGSSVYHYPDISIELLAYRTVLYSGTITMNAHDEYQWVQPHDLAKYDFAPADIPFVVMIRRGEIGFDHGLKVGDTRSVRCPFPGQSHRLRYQCEILSDPASYFIHRKADVNGIARCRMAKDILTTIGLDRPIWLLIIGLRE